MESEWDVNSFPDFWKILKENFSHKIFDCIKGVKLLPKKNGAIFDLKSSNIEVFNEEKSKIKNQTLKFYEATDLSILDTPANYGISLKS